MKPSGRPDLGLLVADPIQSVAGLFTTNAFAAAPVRLSKQAEQLGWRTQLRLPERCSSRWSPGRAECGADAVGRDAERGWPGSDGRMPQTIARMAISWGLVSIPVTVHSATEAAGHVLPLHHVHTRCGGGRVRQRRYCEQEDVEVPWSEVARGYEAPDGRVVILSDEDLTDLPVPAARAIEVLAFVDEESIDPLLADRPYWLGTDGPAGARPYALLRDAMREARQVAVARVALRTRESLALLRVRDQALAMQTLLWPDELRPADDIAVPDVPEARPQELQMAQSLMAAVSEDFRLEEQHDDYQAALEQVVAAKLEGAEPPHVPPSAAAGGQVVDLMSVLEQSLEAARRHRRANPGG
jgi:DNA end-binding protein Ku